MSTKRGLFIVLEGLDRCGKSTQAALLTEWLNTHDIPAETIKFPGNEKQLPDVN